MANLECLGKKLLHSYIEGDNPSSRRSIVKKTLWFLILALVATKCIVAMWVDKNCICIILVAYCGLFLLLLGKWLYYLKAEELSYGLDCLATCNWRYMEMWFNDWKNYLFFFDRFMRSPAFVLIVGYYFQLRIGDETIAEKMLAFARERDADLNTIEMSSSRGLLRKDREVLMTRLIRDLGIVWIYKMKRGLLTALYIFYAVLCLVLIFVLIHLARMLIKGFQ